MVSTFSQRSIGALFTVLAFGGVLVSCSSSSAGQTTCGQYAEMSGDTGLMGNLTSEQEDVLTDMLRENDRDTSQVQLAALQVVAYCNITGGVAGANADRPIENIPGLQ